MTTQITKLTQVQKPEIPRTVIEPSRGMPRLELGELWQYRELFLFMTWRDIKVRYKQSVLGVLWIVLQPFITMVVFSVLFNQLLGIGTDSEVPYPVFTFVALLPWTYFAGVLNRGSISLVANRNLISKIFFPRLIVPVANVLAGLIDFAIGFIMLLGLMLYYGIMPNTRILYLPFAMLLAVITATGFVLWLSALNVKYRDVQYIAPFMVQILMYATPIIYPITQIPERWLWLYNLNPMVGVIQSFRWVLLGDSFTGIGVETILLAVGILVSGFFYFKQTEKVFADVV